MLEKTKRYKHYILFESSNDKDIISPYIFWMAVVILYLVTNAPKNRILIAVNQVLTYFPSWTISQELTTRYEVNSLGELIVEHGIIPIKGLFYFIACLVASYPILRAIRREKTFFYASGTKRRFFASLGIFILLSLLILPYRYPLGTGSMGEEYAFNSEEPFAQNGGWYYRRLLMPAIAHFIQMDRPILYYLFSIFCTYILIFMSLSFIESKIFTSEVVNESGSKSLSIDNYGKRLLYYLSILTSSYLIHNFQFPGYTEQLFFILLLLAACLPMTRQERLATLALSLATHESSIFVFIPIVLFCFPRREIVKPLYLVTLYIVMWLAGNGFILIKAAESQNLDGKSALQYLLEQPALGLAGLFFSYKLLWIIMLYVVWRLWQQRERSLVVAIVSMILFPTLTIGVLALDTSRLMGMSFFGMLICFSILLNEYYKFSAKNVLFIIAIANIICPSYYVGLNTGFQSYPGLYQLISIFSSHYVN